MNRKASLDPPQEPTADQLIRRSVARLRFRFLAPLIVTLALAIMVVVISISVSEYREIEGSVMRLESRIGDLFDNSLQNNARAMQSVLDVLKTDKELVSALAAKDRQRLLQRSVPVYEDINHHFGVTHFYFSDPDRVNLLRVHKREKYGDVVDRQTTLAAQESGEGVSGLELGALGTLTLRYVQPWYEEETQELVGFVELGMEIDQTLDIIFNSFDLDIFVLINKLYLDESSWKDGMQTFGKVSDWNQFPHVVVSMHGRQVLPDALSKTILEKCTIHLEHDVRPQVVSDNHYAVFHGLHDVSGKIVGTMVVIIDASSNKLHIWHSIFINAGTLFAGAVFLILFFYWYVGRLGERLAKDELQLEQLATRDGLTGLLNRRQFNKKLEDSIERYTRYGQPVSLLMIDIDHFKQVNDEYGHLAGDKILIAMGNCLSRQARAIDYVCRYGGEEFAVLLPETDSASGSFFARRLREIMAGGKWDLGSSVEVEITVSIGMASCPEHADASQALLAAADSALYAAKEGGRNRACNFGDKKS